SLLMVNWENLSELQFIAKLNSAAESISLRGRTRGSSPCIIHRKRRSCLKSDQSWKRQSENLKIASGQHFPAFDLLRPHFQESALKFWQLIFSPLNARINE
ncbi:MAG: hypothetical protein LBG86_01245, partial [Puniceicoccales bacterium]|nr:hypothetical protein [Puniceicoccales bacterium]